MLILGAAQAHAQTADTSVHHDSAPTVAQDRAPAQSAAQNDEAAMGNDIVVTAQKREQRISDVPMSITALNAENLELIGGTELSKVSAITPGFVIQLQDKFAPGFSIRGITSNDFQPQAELRVALFQDGVPVTQATASYTELFDIDRIEVERGPQSTLHGRSALNGGVSIYQKRAGDTLGFEGKIAGGNYNYWSAQGVVNLPLSDTLAIRVGALARKRDGFVSDAQFDRTYNAVNAQAYRFAARWTPADDFEMNLIATYDRDDTRGGVPFKSRTFLPLNQTTGAIIGDLNFWTPTHLDTFGTFREPLFTRDIVNISSTMDWRLSDKFSITSISGFRWADALQTGDNDGTPTNMIAYEQNNFGYQVSEELRLNFSDVGPFQGFVGASFFRADNGMDFDLGYDERAMALLLGGTLQTLAPRGLTNAQINAILGPAAAALKPFHIDRQITRAKINTYDIFGDVTADVTARLQVFAGGRVTFDKKEASTQGLLPLGPSRLTGRGLLLQPTPNGAVLTGENDSTTVTGRAGLRYTLARDVNVYAVYGLGKRPEVVQVLNTGAQIIPAESLESAEAGIKARALGGRLSGDLSVYHYKYSNFQTLGTVNGTIGTINAGKAKATGVEAQLSYTPVNGIRLFGSYGWNKARFENGIYDGNRFRNSPDNKYAIGADFYADLGSGRVSFAPLYSWQSKMFFDDNNDRSDLQVRTPASFSDKVVDEYQGAFGLLSARLSFTGDRDRWSFALVGDNLTDEKFIVDAGNTGDNFGIPTFIAGTRRTYRAEFGVKF
ncbi:TonB-dependent receptor [Sphingomonas sp. SORGH_AS_0879]|uniref:TonB-dependent receptor n=1 Tax=Sphingomonas sp. SORGH_AS_0879 TaxID=3041790 RepID=UPI0027D8F11C|nr:TonB-dependent receptor [Sphingomonas sp. SORGH_AS_0879]